MKNQILLFMMGILHLLYPKRCPVCDRPVTAPLFSWDYPICDRCRNRLTRATEPSCKKCGKPLTGERGEYCMDCTHRVHEFVQGKALWVYRGDASRSVHRLKYQNRREYAKSYGQELARTYGDWIHLRQIEAIVPIPLHRKRMRMRGYNQAELIARELGQVLEIPVISDRLIRRENTTPQKELNDRMRWRNLHKAFTVRPGKALPGRILLVDDIYTTGSTMDASAKVLKEAGAAEVYVISVCIGSGY